MKCKYIQINCREEKRIDLRQTNSILKYRPSLIFLEYPCHPRGMIIKKPNFSKGLIVKYPWLKSDRRMWSNIEKLWQEDHKLFVFAVDGPQDLVNRANLYKGNKKYPNKTKNIFWWVRIYLRECFMAKNIQQIMKQYKLKNNLLILIFLQNFHWRHVRFLLSGPSKKEISDFYFRRFKRLSLLDIPKLLKRENKTLFKYWNSSTNFL